ncbi:MAG: flagellar export chaperone FliS [Oscillospiraceae bacterium]|nr:flagellar export chaperone FliS [Oscillospiraceae bacterium]
MAYNPYNRYTEQSVMTMTHGEMLVKLYEETAKQINNAIVTIEKNDIKATNTALQKAQKILNYLSATLDKKYPVSANLAALYDFFIRQLVTANVRKDAALLKEILPMIEELKETFVQVDRLARVGGQSAAQGGGLAITG